MKNDSLRDYSCTVEASCPDSEVRGVYTFEVTVKAGNRFQAESKAEDMVDRKIRLGRFNFPYGSADLIECESVTRI